MNRKVISQIVSACLLVNSLAAYGVGRPALVKAAAGTIPVNTTLDVYGGSVCSLRNAVVAANTGAAFGGCPSGDHIVLPTGNFNLTIVNPGGIETGAPAGDLDLTRSMTITGSATASTVVYAGGSAFGDRIFHIYAGATVTLQNLKISGGFITTGYGGGIFNDGGILTLDRVMLNGNQVDITAGGAGGGVANVGSASQLSIDYSTIASNTAQFGGGIYNDGNLTINHSSVYMNRARYGGGGLDTRNVGTMSTASITNSTFAANIAATGGGISTSSSTLSLRFTTIADNDRDGLYVSGYIPTIMNTLFARNRINCGVSDSGVSISSSGYNLLDANPNECVFDKTKDILDQDPMLTSTMSSHAGSTLTYGFLSTASPAIDPLDNLNCPADDQRGPFFPRPLDGNGDGIATCDIGAYEETPLYDINLPEIFR